MKRERIGEGEGFWVVLEFGRKGGREKSQVEESDSSFGHRFSALASSRHHVLLI
jgi:hypothetical protein